MNTFNGVMTGVLLILFIAIWAWAWSAKNKEKFDKMAQLPMNDNEQDNADQAEVNDAK